VVSLGLQATGARRVSTQPDRLRSTERDVMWATYRAATALGLLALALAPLVAWALRLDSWATSALMAVAAVPLTVMGGQAGILQGERRWLPLAGIYLGMGFGRVSCGVVALLLRPDATGAMLGVAVGALVPAALGWWLLRHPSRRPAEPAGAVVSSARNGGPPRSVLAEVTKSSHALLAFFALSNADVVVARTVLDEQQSGLYAAGVILAKAVLFLPQFVVVVAFPAMSEAGSRLSVHLKGLALVLGIGLLATAGTWLLAPLAVVFVGGSEYAELEPYLWVFAGVGTLLAMIHMMVYSGLARQHTRSVFVLWAGLAAMVGAAFFVDTIRSLVGTVLVVLTAVLLTLIGLGLRPVRAGAEPQRGRPSLDNRANKPD
jgi:O-antigen/teichoic acid export membrane protein